MKTSHIILITIGLFILLSGGCLCSKYNSMIGMDEGINGAWSKVESDYQRRSDLIPNLVEVVQGSANFEKSTLTQVIEARASATQMKIDISNVTPEKLQQFQAAQGQLSAALGRLMVVSEQYPTLRSSEQFKELMASIEGTENRIKVSRNDFNSVTQDYNKTIRTFPNSILAGMFNFKERPYFKAEEGAEKAPKVKFDFK